MHSHSKNRSSYSAKTSCYVSEAFCYYKLLCQQSIWLLQLHDYPYYENFVNAGLKNEADI